MARKNRNREQTNSVDEQSAESIHPNTVETALEQGRTVAESLPRATHIGELKIGDAVIQCAVLEDGTRVLTETGFLEAIGRHNNAPAKGQTGKDRPVFLVANNLDPFISDELRQLWQPILFRAKGGGGAGGVSHGYKAELLPQVCNVYLDADESGQLTIQQKRIAKQCQILIRGFATVGIAALVDEATGYQEERDKDALQRILEAYIAKELLPWAKRFPDEFYKQLFRLKGWQYSPLSVKRPQVVGHLTNDIVYKRLPPGILDKLREENPIVRDGRRAHKHHQFLTEDIGNPHLEKHLAAVTALMRISPNWRKFEQHLARAFPLPDEAIQEDLFLESGETDDPIEE